MSGGGGAPPWSWGQALGPGPRLGQARAPLGQPIIIIIVIGTKGKLERINNSSNIFYLSLARPTGARASGRARARKLITLK